MLSIMFSFLVINNDFQVAYVNMYDIIVIETVDIEDEGGILSFNMRNSEDLSFRCNDVKKWEETKCSITKFSYDISKFIDIKHNIIIKGEEKRQY